MYHPARYLLFITKGAAYPICLISVGMIARGIIDGYLSVGAFIFRVICMIVLVIIGGIFDSSFSSDLRAVFAKRPMPTFITRFTDHGLTLSSVMPAIRSEDVEVLAIFSETGTKLAELTNFHESKVRVGQIISSSTLSPGTTMVHNHPNSSNAFSPNDIAVFMRYRCGRAIVVAKSKAYEAAFSREYSKEDAKRARKRLKQLIRQTKNDEGYVKANEILAKEFGYTFRQHDFDSFAPPAI